MKKRVKAKRGKFIRRRSLNLRRRRDLHKKLTKRLQGLSSNLVTSIKEQVLPILESPSQHKSKDITSTLESLESHFTTVFTQQGQAAYNEILESVISYTNEVYQEAGFSIYHHSQRTQDLVGALMEEYLSLIKTIPQDVIQGARVTLLHSIGGFDKASVVEQLNRISSVSQRRIELIARDQTAKAAEAYNRARALDSNFTHYTWKTVQDSRVSTGDGGHKQLNYRVYSYLEPTAIIDSNGTKGHPAQRPNCRCHSAPLFLREGQELRLVKDKTNGDYYEIITA